MLVGWWDSRKEERGCEEMRQEVKEMMDKEKKRGQRVSAAKE